MPQGAPRREPAEAEAGGLDRGQQAPPSHLRLAALGAIGRRRSRPPLPPLFEHRVFELAPQQPAPSLHPAPPPDSGSRRSLERRPRACQCGRGGASKARARHAGACSLWEEGPQSGHWLAAGLESRRNRFLSDSQTDRSRERSV